MASSGGPQTHPNQAKSASLSGYLGGNSSILLEKSKASMRGSTPDSEALASSDDEQDHFHRLQPINSTLGAKRTRRSSWLTEVQHVPQRKASLSGSGTFSPTSSHPATPSGDSVSWASNAAPSTGTTGGRGHSSSASFPWGGTIWSPDSQKGPPVRLTEVLPSPTSLAPPTSSSAYNEEVLLSPPSCRENVADSAIPFAIPLHPTLKTYRSQSYSVGQLDTESTNQLPPNFGTHFVNGRTRTGVLHTSLQHRPSRPSMLGDLTHDASLLGQVREVDDDNDSSNGSEAGVQLSTTQARTIEQLAMENAMLRQAAADQIESTRGRNRVITSRPATKLSQSAARGNRQRFRESLIEESEYALYQPDQSNTRNVFDFEGVSGNTLNEYAAKKGIQYSLSGGTENRVLEGAKKGQWQSSLGFGGLPDIPQSRRHSFADVPTRPTSISSTDEPQGGFLTTSNSRVIDVTRSNSGGFSEGLARPSQSDNTSYFSAIDSSLRGGEGRRPSASPAAMHIGYNMHNPHGRPQHPGHSQPGLNQLLCIVTFKACRADVFYVQEGTGLQVRPGDLVIVEADRGTDLGTVAHENVTWSKAKELKEQFAEEHYRWLMIFSRHGQNGTATLLNPNGQTITSNNTHTNIIIGAGITTAQSGTSEIPSAEMKPKMIKRLAQTHEIQILRDKEGNEAKAKRVCQQKVAEHRLNMEILDAEFQMDWKKLTFYYFADAYINFNPLVTDLFKIYKTRIWMSAINPASYLIPAAGSQLPLGLGPGAFPLGPDRYADRRHQKIHTSFTHAGASAPSQNRVPEFDRMWNPNRDAAIPDGHPIPSIYTPHFQPQEPDARHMDLCALDYQSAGQAPISFLSRLPPTSYKISDLSNTNYHTQEEIGHGGAKKPLTMGGDWTQTFQELSLDR